MKDAVMQRISTRTYKKEPLTPEEIKQIKDVVARYNNQTGPFGNTCEFSFYINDKAAEEGRKIGTYGFISNPPAFVGGFCKKELYSIVDYGYLFEHIILELTALGFDTCWLGGTFSRKDYRQGSKQRNVIIPAISPVGYRTEKRSLIDRTLRSAAQAKDRKDFDDLFYRFNGTPIKLFQDHPIMLSLEMIRQGPSASNKQPWRVVQDGNYSHFYLKRTPNYAWMLHYDIQAIDIGIALSHFIIGLQHFKMDYTIEIQSDNKEMESHIYIATVTTSKS